MTTSEILPLLKRVKRAKNGWTACCPAHDDQSPSLSIKEAGTKVLLHCHAGCKYTDVIAKLRELAHRAPTMKGPIHTKEPSSGRATAVYEYTDEEGNALFRIERFESTGSNGAIIKRFKASRPVKSASEKPKWVPDLKGVRKVLYRLADLKQGHLVYLVEGEKDVDTLRSRGLIATCNPFGAGKWRSEYNAALRGKNVVILPDNDEAGHNHARAVARSLDGTVSVIKIVHLPGLAEKEDVSDFFFRGGTVDELEGLVERVESCRPSLEGDDKDGAGFHFTILKDLIREPKEQVSYVWVDTLPTGGFAICSSKPKVGKSTLARNLAVAVARGEQFLGRGTTKGRVMCLSLEEKRAEIAEHFRRMGAESEEILIHTGGSPPAPLESLKEAILEYNPILVIVDPFMRVLRVDDLNDYAGVARALEKFVDLSRELNFSLLAIHHDSKQNRSGGEAILGSQALFGAVDSHIQMKKLEGKRIISSVQRYGVDLSDTVVDMDKETGIVVVRGEYAGLAAKRVKNEILKLLSDGGDLKELELKEKLVGNANGVISTALRELVSDNQVARTGNGKRNDPYRYILAK